MCKEKGNNWTEKYHKQARADRYDIYNNLPKSGLTKLANICGCSIPQVKYVLEGYRKDNYNIIKEGEKMAALNIWKVKYCRFESQL